MGTLWENYEESGYIHEYPIQKCLDVKKCPEGCEAGSAWSSQEWYHPQKKSMGVSYERTYEDWASPGLESTKTIHSIDVTMWLKYQEL